MSLDDDLRALAAMQYAAVARRQARALGASPTALRHRLQGPDWDGPTPRVLRLVGAPRGIRQDLMIAVLDAGPGAVISHGTAAAFWRLPGFSYGALHVSRPRSRSSCGAEGTVLHHPRLLPPRHVTELHGIPVTTLARTLFDIAGEVHPGRLDRLIETVVSRSPSQLAVLHALFEELAGTHRAGRAAMRLALASRPEGYVATASGLEARFARILADAGEPPLERQVDLGGHEWIGRVDFLDRPLRIVFEIDSDLHHTSPLDRARDRRRDEQLMAAGWAEVVRLTEDNIWRHPERTLGQVRDARRRRRLALVSEVGPLGSISDTRTG